MPFATLLEGEECAKCGEEELIYWTEDETEKVIEAYMTCDACGYEYPKQIMKKSEDTSDEAVKAELKKML